MWAFQEDLSILQVAQASRQIREEIQSYLFDGLIINFVISPGLSEKDFDILVHDQRGSRAPVGRYALSSDRLGPGLHRALPFERLAAIRIEIEAPRRADPGELLQSWNKNILLAEYFSSAACLPFLEIRAVENDSRKWLTEGTLHQSVASPDAYKDGVDSDLELLLMPFRRVRKARGVHIQVPKGTRQGALAMMVEEIEACVVSEKLFGTYLDDLDDMDDNMVAAHEDKWKLWFDYILDDMEGPCAAMVRLARFSAWSQRYEREMYFCAVDGTCIGGAMSMLSDRQLADAESALLERYRVMRAWNPEAVHNREDAYDSEDEYFEVDRKDILLRRTRDGWLAWSWWVSGFCKRGIPRRSSRKYQDMMERYGDAWIRPLVYCGTSKAVPSLVLDWIG